MRLLTLLTVFLLLSGCSFLSELYIQNRSKTNDMLVTIKYKIPKSEFARKEARMDYASKMLTPKQYRRDKRKTPLTVTHRSDSTLTVLIPASSTARIESTPNMVNMNHILEISYNGKRIPIKEFIAASKKYRWDYVFWLS